jgi:hypothetical protein
MTAVILWFLMFLAHPVYVSITEVHLQNEKIQVLHKVFIDDLESCVKAETGTSLYLFEKNQNSDCPKLLAEYFGKHAVLSRNGKSIPLRFVGFEREDDAAWVYFEADSPNASSGNYDFKNSIFTRHVPEQVNLVYVFRDKDKKTFRCDAKTVEISF